MRKKANAQQCEFELFGQMNASSSASLDQLCHIHHNEEQNDAFVLDIVGIITYLFFIKKIKHSKQSKSKSPTWKRLKTEKRPSIRAQGR